MIVHDAGDRWRLVTQPDHARLSGELLALWRGDGLAAHPRREAIVFAGREHDNGWRESDAAPRWDAAGGRPHDFLSLPPAEKLEIWRRGPRRFAAGRPDGALLIALHALALFGERRAEPGWDELLDELAALRDELLEETGTGAGETAADYRFVDFADLASLRACLGSDEPFARRWPDGLRRGRFDPATGTLHLDPFPLAGATTFQVPARHVQRRRYAGDADLGGELAAARWQELAVRVAPEG